MAGDVVLWMLALLIGLILLGTHIGIALAVCSAVGVWIMLGSVEPRFPFSATPPMKRSGDVSR